jgi:transposase-like protein
MTENESAKFWLSVLTELHTRGVKDIFIACVDGLTGFPEAIESLNMTLRKVLRNHRSFPTDESAMKVIFLAK